MTKKAQRKCHAETLLLSYSRKQSAASRDLTPSSFWIGNGRIRSLRQLGPYQVPVVGADIAAAHGASGEFVDGGCVLQRDWLVTRRHLGHERRRHAQVLGQSRTPAAFSG